MTQLHWTLVEDGSWWGTPPTEPFVEYVVYREGQGFWMAARVEASVTFKERVDISVGWRTAFDAKMRCQSDYDLRVIASGKPRRELFRRRK